LNCDVICAGIEEWIMSIDYEELLSSFVAESTEMLDNAETSILELEQGFQSELVNDIFRTFHTIKGDSGVFGLQRITNLSHSLENVLDMMRDKRLEVNIERVDLLLSGVDLLRQMVGDIQGIESIQIDALMARLKEEVTSPASQTLPQPVTVVKQGESSTHEGGFSLKISRKFIDVARADNHFLTLIYLDLYKQKVDSLLSIRMLLESLEDTGQLLMQGVFASKRPLPGKMEQDLLPYYLLVKTAYSPEEYLGQHGISGKLLKKLVVPEKAAEEAEPVVVEDISRTEQGAEAVQEVSDSQAIQAVCEAKLPPAVAGGFFQETLPSAEALKQKAIDNEKRAAEQSCEHRSGNKKESTAKTVAAGGRDLSAEAFLKVHIDLLDELINLAGETIIARNALMQKVERCKDPALLLTGKKISYLVTKLQESIMRTRLQEIGTIFQRLPRLVRDLSQLTGKKVELVTEGGEVELDKTLIDAIVDPVMHMVRNSIDHGLESEELRVSAGKNPVGILRIAATLRGGNVVLTIHDDGRGLNVEKIRATALRKGVVTERELELMIVEDIYELIFEPGFSTAENISQTSGRGVGMDVVRTNYKRVGGSVDILSEPGKGTSFIVTLPQTLSIITCLMIRIQSKLYALPQQNIEELILIDPSQITMVEDHKMYKLRDHLLPLVQVAEVLYPETEIKAAPEYIAVVRTDRHRFGMMIDEIMNPEEIVVKPLGEHFSELVLFSGAAIMGDGEAVLILDVPGIARFTNLQNNLREELEAERVPAVAEEEVESGYLVVGVSGNRFAIPVNSVPRIEKVKPGMVESFMDLETIIFNEEIVALVLLEKVYGLQRQESEAGSNVLIFNINDMRIGVLADRIYNVVDSIPNLETGAYLGESILGQAIINDEKTVVLDVVDLLSRLQSSRFRELHQYIEAREQGPAASALVDRGDA